MRGLNRQHRGLIATAAYRLDVTEVGARSMGSGARNASKIITVGGVPRMKGR